MKFEYKGKQYVIEYYTQVNINDEWKDAIVYKCLYKNPDGMIWVRLKDEFFELFKVVQDEID